MKVGIVGAGNVGATIAYTLALKGIATEITLIDRNEAKAQGEILDLQHGLPFTDYVELKSGGLEGVAGADVVVVTAGIPRKPGESRLDVAKKNNEVFREIMPKMASANPDAIYLIVSNPVDVVTYAAIKYSGLKPNQVFGSGNVLDTARFRSMLGSHFRVDPSNVHAYALGEHGDSSFPVWSQATIGCTPLERMDGYDKAEMGRIFERVKSVAADVIRLKGATYYAIGLGVVKVLRAIDGNENKVLPVSTLLQGYLGISDVCLSIPAVINRRGVDRVLRIPLNEQERGQLAESAAKVGKVLDETGIRGPGI